MTANGNPIRSIGENLVQTLDSDLQAFNDMEGVQTILRVLRRITGMRISMVVRTTDETWTTCAVLDDANFGFKPGGQLEFQTTY